ncbi:hypothetical protein [Desulfonema magnum]|uniref:DUF4351 domain-containing protein n=1 Tax=Desulfonema magnum TaxID=45655 RepID=A0A975BJP5_9BACT|nr:hypothetical protein [Desulfonema magnum]QTA86556.1 Uncharacterized protein dnm_025800 [Desulfonema magnum]
MKSKDGTAYAQNYDVIVKWLAAALRGETLEVLGLKTGRIEEVFAFEPADISVKAGRVDVMLRDDTGAIYHVEEQRNLKKTDIFRFAAYHFLGAEQWGVNLTDIILASGEVWAGEKGSRAVTTKSGKYDPVVIDFTERDGRKRLGEIREAVSAGTFENWLELVFLPLYGRETGEARSEIAEEVLRFENELYCEKKISVRLLAATLVMSNRLIDKERLRAFWEEVKMLDIFEIAREEGEIIGIGKGEIIGIEKGKNLGILEDRREMVTDVLIERFGVVLPRILEQIRAIQNPDVLKMLHRQALKCQNLQEFEAVLDLIDN